jgi:hypothetical protein
MTMTFGKMAGLALLSAFNMGRSDDDVGEVIQRQRCIGKRPNHYSSQAPNPPGSRAKRGKKPKALRFK